MSKPENPPAFPVKVRRNTSRDPRAAPREIEFEGMSLRDWFAGQAMAAIISGAMSDGTVFKADGIPLIAGAAGAMADAMLAERERGQ